MKFRTVAILILLSSILLVIMNIHNIFWFYKNVSLYGFEQWYIMRLVEMLSYFVMMVFSKRMLILSQDEMTLYTELAIASDEAKKLFSVLKTASLLGLVSMFISFKNHFLIGYFDLWSLVDSARYNMLNIGLLLFALIGIKFGVEKLKETSIVFLIVFPTLSILSILSSFRFVGFSNNINLLFFSADMFRHITIMLLGIAFISRVKEFGDMPFRFQSKSSIDYDYEEDYSDDYDNY